METFPVKVVSLTLGEVLDPKNNPPTEPPEEIPRSERLSTILQLYITGDESEQYIPPPPSLNALLSLITQLFNVMSDLLLQYIPPPELLVFSLMLLSETVGDELSQYNPPPNSPELFFKLQFLIKFMIF